MAMNHSEWQKVARTAGQTKGWTCYTENNIFGGMGSFAHNYVIANAWYCTHLWQHYRYTLDKDFLKKAFPTMWSATEFWLQRLILDKSDNTYVCPKEYSPEQGPYEDGVAHAQQLVWDLFANTKSAAEVLGSECGVKQDSLSILADRLEKLDKGLHTETYTGNWGVINGVKKGDLLLREWKTSPYTTGSQAHRHMSHLMCLYPFNQVTSSSPYFTPAVNSLKLRGDQSTGWSMGWKINLWARALDGDHAHTILAKALRHSTSYGVNENAGGIYYNLYDSHSPFQIDGNFGACAGIAEMLLQSQTDTLQLLPALPSVWAEGSITGLKAVGDFTVDMSWKDKQLLASTIVSNAGQPLAVKYPKVADMKVTVNGAEAEVEKQGTDVIIVKANKGDKVVIESLQAVGIGNVQNASGNVKLQVSGRTVTVTSANVDSITVSDLSGRRVLYTHKPTFTVTPNAGNLVILNVAMNDGKNESFKLAF